MATKKECKRCGGTGKTNNEGTCIACKGGGEQYNDKLEQLPNITCPKCLGLGCKWCNNTGKKRTGYYF